MSAPTAIELVEELLQDVKNAHDEMRRGFDRWNALAQAVISDGTVNDYKGAAWEVLKAQLEVSG